MSEKRFKLRNKREVSINYPNTERVYDYEKGDFLYNREIEYLLNSLVEEKEQLKQENDKYRVMINANANLNERLAKENEKLKQTINSQQLTITNKQSIIKELFEQKRFCEKMAQNLKNENEQLRKDLHIEQTDCKNQKESKEYWRKKCEKLINLIYELESDIIYERGTSREMEELDELYKDKDIEKIIKFCGG